MQKIEPFIDLNAPNGSRDISSFQSQEFEQDGSRHFEGFELHFHTNVTSQTILQDNEKMKVRYLRSLLFDLFETLQAVRTWQRNFT